MNKIAVVDYGMGNLHSVVKAIEHVADNIKVIVTEDPKVILDANKVIFPGVGAIRDCIAELKRLGLDDAIRKVAESRPLLGICVGMQALMEHSAENGGTSCLGILPGEVLGFSSHGAFQNSVHRLKVPHMGWNQVHQDRVHPLWNNIPQDSRFYFVHSYYVQSHDTDIIASTSQYGVTFASSVVKNNIFAVQFHPEKSQSLGLTFYKNFLNWSG